MSERAEKVMSGQQRYLNAEREYRRDQDLVSMEDMVSLFHICDYAFRHALKQHNSFPAPIPGRRGKVYRFDEVEQWMLTNHPAYRSHYFALQFIRGNFDAPWQRQKYALKRMVKKHSLRLRQSSSAGTRQGQRHAA